MSSNSDDKTIITDSANLTMVQAMSPKKRACLVQYSGSSLGRRYILESQEVTIGRAPTTGIVIPESSVSREHAKCVTNANRVEIVDLNSSNGTFVNDTRVSAPTALRDGDIIRLGSILLKFFAHDNIDNVFHDKIYRMATIDAGTQIFNKKYLLEALENEFKFSRVYGRPLSIIYYDLDFFKKVNDVHGHNCGDYILKESAQVTKAIMRKDDVFGRYGGEEFVIVLPNTDAKVAADLAERVRKQIEAYNFEFSGKVLKQTVSMGVSENMGKFQTFKDLLEDADKKLYQSKSGGRNRVTI